MSPSKYQPLIDWLATYAGHSVTLTFTELEAILGEPLPVTARMERTWWTRERDGHVHVRLWRARGWEMQAFDRWERTVTFVRTADEAPS
jgi:hypothetical protein